jgi:hypothetical protein
LSLLFVPVVAGRAIPQTADDVVEKHLTALGGRDTLGKITSRRSTGTITIATPGGDLSGPIEISAKAPNKTRVLITLDVTAVGGPGDMVIDQKFDGVAGWSLNSLQGDNEITGNQLDNMRNNVFPSALLTYKAAGTRIEVLPKEQLAGKDVIVLRVTPKAGSVSKWFLDAQTYLVVRTVATVNSPQLGGDIEQTSDLSDYRAVDGVKVAFQVINSNPLQTGTVKLTKVEHNVTIDDAVFSKK